VSQSGSGSNGRTGERGGDEFATSDVVDNWWHAANRITEWVGQSAVGLRCGGLEELGSVKAFIRYEVARAEDVYSFILFQDQKILIARYYAIASPAYSCREDVIVIRIAADFPPKLRRSNQFHS
jgi:hypothetical protein